MPTGTPKTWASGNALTALLANQEFRDQFIALYGAPVGHLRRSGGGGILVTSQSQASAVTTVTSANRMTFNNAASNAYTGAMTTGSSPWSRLIAPIDGIYEVNGMAAWVSGGATAAIVVTALLQYNGTTIVEAEARNLFGHVADIIAPDTGPYSQSCPQVGTELRMLAGDFVELYATNTAAPIGSSSLSVAGESYLTLTWIGNLA